MTIEFLTDENPLYVLPFFEEFLGHYASEFEIAQVSFCRAMGKRSRVKLLRELASLYGLLGFARLFTHFIWARFLGLLPRSRHAVRFHSLPQLCRALSIPFARVDNPNASRFVDDVRKRDPDLIVSVACPYIVKEPLLSLPKLGSINIHNSPLPKYKGMMPTFWQMYHGEKKVGITIHYMAAGIDEGPALFRGELEIEPGESLDHLIRRSKCYGAHCMAQVLREIRSQTQRVIALAPEQGSYFTFPSIQQIREFRRRGNRAI